MVNLMFFIAKTAVTGRPKRGKSQKAGREEAHSLETACSGAGGIGSSAGKVLCVAGFMCLCEWCIYVLIAKTAVTGSGRAKTDSQNNQIAGKAQQAYRQNTVGSDTDGEESSSSGKLHVFYRMSDRFYRLVMYRGARRCQDTTGKNQAVGPAQKACFAGSSSACKFCRERSEDASMFRHH